MQNYLYLLLKKVRKQKILRKIIVLLYPHISSKSKKVYSFNTGISATMVTGK